MAQASYLEDTVWSGACEVARSSYTRGLALVSATYLGVLFAAAIKRVANTQAGRYLQTSFLDPLTARLCILRGLALVFGQLPRGHCMVGACEGALRVIQNQAGLNLLPPCRDSLEQNQAGPNLLTYIFKSFVYIHFRLHLNILSKTLVG